MGELKFWCVENISNSNMSERWKNLSRDFKNKGKLFQVGEKLLISQRKSFSVANEIKKSFEHKSFLLLLAQVI